MKIQKSTPIVYNSYSQSLTKKSENRPSYEIEFRDNLASTSQIPFTGMNKLVPKVVSQDIDHH